MLVLISSIYQSFEEKVPVISVFLLGRYKRDCISFVSWMDEIPPKRMALSADKKLLDAAGAS